MVGAQGAQCGAALLRFARSELPVGCLVFQEVSRGLKIYSMRLCDEDPGPRVSFKFFQEQGTKNFLACPLPVDMSHPPRWAGRQ